MLQFITHRTERYDEFEQTQLVLDGGCRWIQLRMKDACTRTGYKGRRALFEVLEVDEDIEGAIVRRENATQIRNLSLSKGMKTLREDGWAKVFAGVTSVKEILRVTEEQ